MVARQLRPAPARSAPAPSWRPADLAGVTGAAGSCGARVGPRMLAASAISASFGSWSFGTKLLIDQHARPAAASPAAAPARPRRRRPGPECRCVNGLVSGRITEIVQGLHRLGIRVLRVQRIGVEARAAAAARAPSTARTPNTASIGRRWRRITCVQRHRPGEPDLGLLARAGGTG